MGRHRADAPQTSRVAFPGVNDRRVLDGGGARMLVEDIFEPARLTAQAANEALPELKNLNAL